MEIFIMITQEQQQWLDHLSGTETISILPWDQTAEDKFRQVKNQIQGIIGINQSVEHRGATSLKISGQDEIDIYVPVPVNKYDVVVNGITLLYGKPRSHYPLKRTRFVTFLEGKHIDVFVINQEDVGWINCELFHNYLLSDQAALDEYRVLKENGVGKSVKEYYRVKIEFINVVLERINVA